MASTGVKWESSAATVSFHRQWFCSPRTPGGTRTRNLRIRSPTPCPLGHGGNCWLCANDNFSTSPVVRQAQRPKNVANAGARPNAPAPTPPGEPPRPAGNVASPELIEPQSCHDYRPHDSQHVVPSGPAKSQLWNCPICWLLKMQIDTPQ